MWAKVEALVQARGWRPSGCGVDRGLAASTLRTCAGPMPPNGQPALDLTKTWDRPPALTALGTMGIIASRSDRPVPRGEGSDVPGTGSWILSDDFYPRGWFASERPTNQLRFRSSVEARPLSERSADTESPMTVEVPEWRAVCLCGHRADDHTDLEACTTEGCPCESYRPGDEGEPVSYGL